MFKNKKVIITGANRGIGKSILKKFSKNRATIFSCTRKKDKDFIDYCKTLESQNKCKIINIYFDLESAESVKLAAKDIISQSDEIDVLINNAGMLLTAPFLLTKIDDIKLMFEVNFFSQLIFSQIIIKKMIRKKSGSIINISSTSGIEGNEGRLGYSSSKAALIMFSKVLSKELGPYNIRVNSIAPGLTDTLMLHNNTKDEIIQGIKNKLPLKRLAKPEDIANTVFFLASDSSAYITGQVFNVDGGLV